MNSIPYEKQDDHGNGRMCGAACLSMAYRSFGKEIGQAEIWPLVAKLNRFGSLACTTHLMAKDALTRGFVALTIGARHPIQALRRCHDAGLRAILNHRLEASSATGHYTLLVDMDDTTVTLHDPTYGPARRISHAELLQLWQPQAADSEIAGGVLIAIAEKAEEIPPCEFCQTPTEPCFECVTCHNAITLQPGAVLGCMNANCIARMWNYICCPGCDSLWNFDPNAERPEASAISETPPTPSAPNEPLSLHAVFEQIDKFCEHFRNRPGVAENAELQQQIQSLVDTKSAMKLALAEAAVYGQAHLQQMAAFADQAKQNSDAHRARAQEANKPLPPLDARALGRALLKDLGFSA